MRRPQAVTPSTVDAVEGPSPAGRKSNRGTQLTAELLDLQTSDGLLHPRTVVNWAQDNVDSALHSALEWDNAVAGDAWRMQQVRQLIALHLIDASGGPRLVSLSIDRSHGGGYRVMEQVMATPDLREIALNDALAELRRVEEKHQHLIELERVWQARSQVETEARVLKAASTAAARSSRRKSV
jgi:hypothetical protein